MPSIPAQQKMPAPDTLRAIALSLPGAEAGTSCNKIAYKAGGKNFLFVGGDDESYNAMFKLADSLAEAEGTLRERPRLHRGWKEQLDHPPHAPWQIPTRRGSRVLGRGELPPTRAEKVGGGARRGVARSDAGEAKRDKRIRSTVVGPHSPVPIRLSKMRLSRSQCG